MGKINDQQAVLLVERAAFSTEPMHLKSLAQSLSKVSNLGANDIYSWFLASSGHDLSSNPGEHLPPDLKLNLIYPCTPKHVAKYSAQGLRVVTETPEIYRDHIRPYMQAQREAGRLNWVFNIIDGKTEQEDVILRSHTTSGTKDHVGDETHEDEGFLLLPDLNWDRKTLSSLHLLGLVERRDIWSVRDLTKRHVPWLERMRRKLLEATTTLYPDVEEDQLKLYVHYQPTYYHFHVHVAHVMSEASSTQAVGKALGLDDIMSQLQSRNDEYGGMDGVSLTYTLGEASELWTEVFLPLKTGGR